MAAVWAVWGWVLWVIAVIAVIAIFIWPGWLIGGPLWDRFQRPSADLRVDKTTVRPGQTVKLTWKTDRADEVTLNDEDVETKGSQTASPTEDTDYVLVATNDKGDETRSVKVTVKGSPVSPSPTTVKPSESAKVAPSESAKSSASAQPASQPATSQSQLGCAGKDVGAVQGMIGLSVVCLGTEYDAYTWRSVPQVVDANVPQGWIATLHLQDNRIVVVTQPGKYQIQAGTFRRIAGYPATDAVYNACALLTKEQAFGASQTPSFPVEAMGFDCNGKVSVQSQQVQPAQAAPAAAQQATGQQAPAQAAPAPAQAQPQAACLTPSTIGSTVGGTGWKIMPNTNNEGMKYGPGAPPMTMSGPPSGRVDHAGGSIRSGQTAQGVSEATYWCNG